MSQLFRRLALLAGGLLFVVGVAVWWRYVFPAPPKFTLPSRFAVRPHERIMIFAPHSDDEVLGPGGLIQRAVRRGAEVRVVLVTNGDGFTLAVEDQFHSLRVTPQKYIQFAYLRQKETLAALASLGVPASAVTFLGFPDRGTAREWEDYWLKSNPYTSRYTRTSHSPYRNSYVRETPFSGAALAEQIIRLIREFRPDTIILPHPNDLHPDHWATHNFVVYALAMMDDPETGGPLLLRHPPRLLNYLVHRGNWPAPKGYHPYQELAPPPRLLASDTRWGAFPLRPWETERKHQAILKYGSQVRVMHRYLVSFARANDLFGVLPPTPAVGEKTVTAVLDPIEDSFVREVEGAADLRRISLNADRDYVYCRLTLRRRPSALVTYLLHFHALPASPEQPPVRHDLRLRFVRGRWVAHSAQPQGFAPDERYPVTASGSTLIIRFPREAAGPRRLFFVAAETRLGELMDRTAWRCVELSPR
ncbi:MAG TPA: PIG-L family deacetylase [Firmicutes bacterium]|nr:PIG-L family deacetylase [Bacillota bacterium]